MIQPSQPSTIKRLKKFVRQTSPHFNSSCAKNMLKITCKSQHCTHRHLQAIFKENPLNLKRPGGSSPRKKGMDSVEEWTSLPKLELFTLASHRKERGKGSQLNHPSHPPDNPIGQGTELMLPHQV